MVKFIDFIEILEILGRMNRANFLFKMAKCPISSN